VCCAFDPSEFYARRNSVARRLVRRRVDSANRGNARAAQSWQVWTALAIVYLVWGSTYLAIRVAVRTLPPLLHAGVRFLVAGAIMYLVLRLRRRKSAMRLGVRELGACALTGAALLVGGNGVVALAEQEVPSSIAALIIASVPLWVVVFRFLTGERVGGGTLLGVALGFGGVALLLQPGSGVGGSLHGHLLLVGASTSWAAGSFFSRRLPLPADPFLSTAVQMLCAGILLGLAGAATGELRALDPSEFSAVSLFALAYLVGAGSLLAFTAYTWLLQNAPISKVSTYAYVNPVIAVLLGAVLLSEAITPVMVLGASVIVVAVALTVRLESSTPDDGLVSGAHAPEAVDPTVRGLDDRRPRSPIASPKRP
jgi:drug/metabolite transporter (DMT)-like permease